MRQRRLQWFGQVIGSRLEGGVSILADEVEEPGRSCGRPKKTGNDTVQRDLNMTLDQSQNSFI